MAFFKDHFPVKDKLVLVTGASQGLGYTLSKKLFSKGASVILIARNSSKLEANVKEISKSKISESQFVDFISADLADYNQSLKILKYLEDKQLYPDILFCLAGSSHPDFFLNLTPEQLEQGIDINYKTSLYFVHALGKNLIKNTSKSEKHVVLCSSTVAFYSFIGYTQYAPMKTAVKSLGDSLRQEFKPYDIKVHTLFPGNFASEGYAEENTTKPEITSIIEGASEPISVDQCCDVVLYWLSKGDHYVFTDLISWVLASFSLGFNPRNFWPLQVILALVGALISRIVAFFHDRDIQKEFDKLGGFIKEGKKDD